MGYITTAYVKLRPGGLKLSGFTDYDLQSAIDIATTLCDTVAGRKWSYGRVLDEERPWYGETLQFLTYRTPLRTLQTFGILTGTTEGHDWEFDLSTVAPAITDPTVLPTSWGDIKINRATGRHDASDFIYAQLSGGLASFASPYLKLAYTAGYDAGPQVSSVDSDGTIHYARDGNNHLIPTADDGYILPAPQWLQDVCLDITREQIAKMGDRSIGLGAGLQEVRVADTLYRKPLSMGRGTGGKDTAVSDEARAILQYNRGG